MEQRAASMYTETSARGASPLGIIVSLYDTILRDLRRAQAALKAQDIETRVFELNHALTVVAHLQSVLNHEKGAEAAARFQQFYRVTRAMILSANVNPNPQTFEKLIEMFGSMRMAWYQAEQRPISKARTLHRCHRPPNQPMPSKSLPVTPPARRQIPSGEVGERNVVAAT